MNRKNHVPIDIKFFAPNDKERIHGKLPAIAFDEVVVLNKRLHNSTSSPSGASCIFIHSDKLYPSNIGLKAYFSLEEAILARSTQLIANSRGVGPSVHGGYVLIYCTMKSGEKESYSTFDRLPKILFGYKTQVATKISKKYKTWSIYRDQYESVMKILREIGLGGDASYNWDTRNFGVIDNKLVLVDFGTESFPSLVPV